MMGLKKDSKKTKLATSLIVATVGLYALSWCMFQPMSWWLAATAVLLFSVLIAALIRAALIIDEVV